jgi:hypothetical protein
MPNKDDWFDESDDELDEDEFSEKNDDDDPTETVTCHSCGAEVYEDAEQCPYCGMYLTADTSPWSGRSPWWVVLALLGLIATVLALMGVFL